MGKLQTSTTGGIRNVKIFNTLTIGIQLEMMIEVVGHPLALTDRDLYLILFFIIETFSIGILILFIFKIEQFAKSIVLGCVKEVAV